MYRYILEANGSLVELTGQEKKWQLLYVKGLNPPQATLHTTTIIGANGVRKVGSKIDPRTIEIALHINNPCRQNRQELLRFLSSNQELTIRLLTGNQEYYIEGTVEDNSYEIYTQSQEMVVSILCEDPYFKNTEERIVKNTESRGGFQFPFSFTEEDRFRFDELYVIRDLYIYNYGTHETGLELEIHILNETTNPKLVNVDDPTKYIGFNDTFYPGDVIKINTNSLAKNKVMLVRNGVETKLLNKLMVSVTWFKVKDILVLRYESLNNEYAFIKIANHDKLLGV